jgi:ABC-type transport system involved in multi-copper enzyme maturation permease subunit
MKISNFVKALIYLFVCVILTQALDASYYLLNQKDSWVANLGIVALSVTVISILYCFMAAIRDVRKAILEELEKQKQSKN